jgi:hypothetical protein
MEVIDGTSQVTYSINLPVPTGIVFADQGNYSTVDLGILDPIAYEAASQAIQGNFSGARDAVASGVNKAKSLEKGEIASLIAKAVGLGSVADANLLKTRRAFAPNTNTSFSGNAVRNFSFAFKMVARSRGDTSVMRDIHSTFRKYVYADANDASRNIVIDYPPTWKIQFYDGNKENVFIPKIYDAYCTSINSTFNPNTTAVMMDGSPVEIDITVTFQETRALTRKDIVELSHNV